VGGNIRRGGWGTFLYLGVDDEQCRVGSVSFLDICEYFFRPINQTKVGIATHWSRFSPIRLTSCTTTKSFITVTPSSQGVLEPMAPIVWAYNFARVPSGSGVDVDTAYMIPTGWLKVS
jgi:hypothetical protein